MRPFVPAEFESFPLVFSNIEFVTPVFSSLIHVGRSLPFYWEQLQPSEREKIQIFIDRYIWNNSEMFSFIKVNAYGQIKILFYTLQHL